LYHTFKGVPYNKTPRAGVLLLIPFVNEEFYTGPAIPAGNCMKTNKKTTTEPAEITEENLR
jgi:hypothetical protein